MTMIQIQDDLIHRLLVARAKQGPRSAGIMYSRTRRAAYAEAAKRLARLGYSEAQANQIIKDAHDMYLLERNTRD